MTRFCLVFLAAAIALPAAVTIERYHSHDFSFSASAAGNPFDVDLSGEFTGPDGVRLRIPGFYDGGGVWKIRFSPTRPGRWSLRTTSRTAALDGKTEAEIECTPNRHPQIHGGLKVDAAHPYHFIYEDGTRYFLLGYEADWLWGIDMRDPQRTVMRRLIDRMAGRGFNHVMVNVYAHDTSWSKGRQNQWDYGPPEMFPWEGTNEKPDHTRLNPAFFKLYDGMMETLRDKGIVAHIMLKVYNKMVRWPEPNSVDEQRYFRYVVARYQAFSNLVWDFSKEAQNERDDQLQHRLIDSVKSMDAYHRLMTVHDDDVYEHDPELSSNVDFRTDQQHTDWAEMVGLDRAVRRRPVLNSEFGYERGLGPSLPTYRVVHDWEEQVRRGWLVYMAGGYGVYYYHYTSWDVVKVDDEEPPGMKRFQMIKDAFTSLPYWRMEPSNSLAAGGPCLALPGEAYLFYVEGPRLVANLQGLEGGGSGEWIDTWTGAKLPVPVGKAGIVMLAKPAAFGKAPAALVVRRQAR